MLASSGGPPTQGEYASVCVPQHRYSIGGLISSPGIGTCDGKGPLADGSSGSGGGDRGSRCIQSLQGAEQHLRPSLLVTPIINRVIYLSLLLSLFIYLEILLHESWTFEIHLSVTVWTLYSLIAPTHIFSMPPPATSSLSLSSLTFSLTRSLSYFSLSSPRCHYTD